MMYEGSENNREQRMLMAGEVEYRYAPNHCGTARWQDVSRIGAAIRLGRYLRPGRHVTLMFPSPLIPNVDHEVEARIIWCEQIPGALEFIAGLEVRQDTPEMALSFAALGYAAQREYLNESNANREGDSDVVTLRRPVWPARRESNTTQLNANDNGHAARPARAVANA